MIKFNLKLLLTWSNLTSSSPPSINIHMVSTTYLAPFPSSTYTHISYSLLQSAAGHLSCDEPLDDLETKVDNLGILRLAALDTVASYVRSRRKMTSQE